MYLIVFPQFPLSKSLLQLLAKPRLKETFKGNIFENKITSSTTSIVRIMPSCKHWLIKIPSTPRNGFYPALSTSLLKHIFVNRKLQKTLWSHFLFSGDTPREESSARQDLVEGPISAGLEHQWLGRAPGPNFLQITVVNTCCHTLPPPCKSVQLIQTSWD